MNLNEILSHFPDAKKTGNGWICKCPAHDDRTASLSISEGRDGRTLIKCFAGCTVESICAKLGLKLSDLFADQPERNGSTAQISAVYDYHDHDGKLVFQVVRYSPKTFKQRRPDPAKPGEWLWNMDGVSRVLYRLPEVLKAKAGGKPVVISEGEK